MSSPMDKADYGSHSYREMTEVRQQIAALTAERDALKAELIVMEDYADSLRVERDAWAALAGRKETEAEEVAGDVATLLEAIEALELNIARSKSMRGFAALYDTAKTIRERMDG